MLIGNCGPCSSGNIVLKISSSFVIIPNRLDCGEAKTKYSLLFSKTPAVAPVTPNKLVCTDSLTLISLFRSMVTKRTSPVFLSIKENPESVTEGTYVSFPRSTNEDAPAKLTRTKIRIIIFMVDLQNLLE